MFPEINSVFQGMVFFPIYLFKDTLSSESRAPCIPSSRLKVVVMCFTMAVCHYLMRANLSVAIVCMNSDPQETAGNASYNSFNVTTDGYTESVTDAMIPHELKVCVWTIMWPGPRLSIKTAFPMYGVPMLKIRRSRHRLIFNTGSLYW